MPRKKLLEFEAAEDNSDNTGNDTDFIGDIITTNKLKELCAAALPVRVRLVKVLAGILLIACSHSQWSIRPSQAKLQRPERCNFELMNSQKSSGLFPSSFEIY